MLTIICGGVFSPPFLGAVVEDMLALLPCPPKKTVLSYAIAGKNNEISEVVSERFLDRDYPADRLAWTVESSVAFAMAENSLAYCSVTFDARTPSGNKLFFVKGDTKLSSVFLRPGEYSAGALADVFGEGKKYQLCF